MLLRIAVNMRIVPCQSVVHFFRDLLEPFAVVPDLVADNIVPIGIFTRAFLVTVPPGALEDSSVGPPKHADAMLFVFE